MKTAHCAALMLAVLAAPATWGQAKGDALRVGQFLKTDEYLVEMGKRSFAVMQADGNLCVYKGTGPTDNKGRIWCSNKAPGKGEYFAIMQGDANLCVYKGTGPTDNKGHVWCSAATRPASTEYFAKAERNGITVYAVGAPGVGPMGGGLPSFERIWGSAPPAKGFGG